MTGFWVVQAGFTFVEMLVSLLLSLFVMAAIIMLLGSSSTTFRVFNQSSDMDGNGRFSLLTIERSLKHAGMLTRARDRRTVAFPALSPFATGEYIHVLPPVGDKSAELLVRFQGAADGTLLDCAGNVVPRKLDTLPETQDQSSVMSLWVDEATDTLWCRDINSDEVPLANNVATVRYLFQVENGTTYTMESLSVVQLNARWADVSMVSIGLVTASEENYADQVNSTVTVFGESIVGAPRKFHRLQVSSTLLANRL